MLFLIQLDPFTQHNLNYLAYICFCIAYLRLHLILVHFENSSFYPNAFKKYNCDQTAVLSKANILSFCDPSKPNNIVKLMYRTNKIRVYCSTFGN